ncbi:hypothetical protein Droror1_Dr00019291 [Drosera rotundifolia]
MSLNTFKEILKPCTNLSSKSPISNSQFNDPIPNPRKPPKTSLAQQLLRIDDPFSPIPQKPPKILVGTENQGQNGKQLENQFKGFVVDDDGVEDEDGESGRGEIGKKRLESFVFDHTGPYEPLVLSMPGEISVIQVPASINCRLLEHQREGVTFLYKLYKNKHGGILGDDMGLGKTIQAIAFLAAIYGKDGDSDDSPNRMQNECLKGPALIICPTSVIHNWESEFSKWANFQVSVYHGTNRDLIFDRLGVHAVEVLITSFDTYRIHDSILSEVKWEVVIVDEAGRLKNEKSKLYQACLGIKTRNRYGLTGTVMQNNIMELFNLFNWVAPESLGTREHFHEFYDEPLKQGQRLTAPDRFVQIADERKRHLASVLHKYLLRRTKEETIGHLMLGKEDNVVFCAMSELQKRVYRRMLLQPEIQCLINKDLPCTCGSPLSQVECCKRTLPDGIIWNYLHRDNPEGCDSCPFCVVLPCLIKLQQISNHLELIKPSPKDDTEKQKKDAEFAAAVFGPDLDLVSGTAQNESFMGLSDVKHCGKMRALDKLMFTWISHSDKVLLFSHSVRMLDILEKFLIRRGYCFSRLDGSTPTGLRQNLVNDFNSSPSKQAQDRSFRFGQKRHVIVFRLLAAGSLEELVYTRQVYKQQLSNIAVSGKMEKRYFEGVQDCKEFQGELFGIHNLFRDLSEKLFTSEIIEMHGSHGKQSTVNGSKHHMKDLEMHFNPSTETGESSLQNADRGKHNGDRAARNKPVLEELGIVYSHRNEEVVNMGPGHETSKEVNITPGDSSRNPSLPIMKQRPPLPSKEDKKRQFGLLAAYMGMGELEFSRWVLSATPEQREQVLRDYKKRRKQEI